MNKASGLLSGGGLEGAAQGLLTGAASGFVNGVDEVANLSFGIDDAFRVNNLVNSGDNPYTGKPRNMDDYEAVDPEGNQSPMIGDTPVSSRPGWEWLYNKTTNDWEAVPKQEEMTEAGGGGGDTSSGGGNPGPDVELIPNTTEGTHVESWRKQMEDGRILAGNEVGDVWEVEPEVEDVNDWESGLSGLLVLGGELGDYGIESGTTGGIGGDTSGGTNNTGGSGGGTSTGDGLGDTNGEGPGEGDSEGDGPGLEGAATGLLAGIAGSDEFEGFMHRLETEFPMLDPLDVSPSQLLQVFSETV